MLFSDDLFERDSAACFAPNEVIAQGRHGWVDAVGADACGVFVVAVDVVGVGIEAHLLHHCLRQCLRLNDVEGEFFEDFVQQADFAFAEFYAVFEDEALIIFVVDFGQ
ncbi:hypothetical protein HMPREF3156_02135 [Neisseria sp. HMSC06F02]|nr:hypothetical protein HMPREF3156_02135 [Neisseria sp. HMSC06F02]